MKTRHIIIAITACVAFALTGCTHQGGILRSWFGRKAATVEKQEQKQTAQEDKAVQAAAVETFKTSRALASAPESRAVEVARRTNGNALNLLQQREPLTLAMMQDATSVVDGLLSAETAKREQAEKRQADAEAKAAQLSDELAEIRRNLDAARQAEKKEAARNLELANELRWKNYIAWGSSALSLLLGVATIAYKMNVGRLQEGAAEMLAKIGTKHGGEAETTARTVLDAILHTGEQQGVAKYYRKLTAK